MAREAKAHTRKPIGTPHKRSTTHRPREQRAHASARLYNYRWSLFAKAFLKRKPLCEYCLAINPLSPVVAVVCDHDLPHEQDPVLFWNNTFTALCVHHHSSVKQRMELQYKGDALLEAVKRAKLRKFGYSIPHGLTPSNVPVILVCGPPAGGKSTWVKANAQEQDLVIDFDVYRERIGGTKWDNRPSIVKEAFRLRADDIKSLSERTKGKAYLLVLAPTKGERDAWMEALGQATVKMIMPDQSVCIDRARADPRRANVQSMQAPVIRKWFDDFTA